MSDGAPLRVAVTALGCKVNYAEMADLAGGLAALGCDVVGETAQADVRVLNSCTVTLQADATTRQRLRRLRRQDPDCHVILTGCSVDANPDLYLRPGAQGRRLPFGVDAVFNNAEKSQISAHIAGMIPASQSRANPARPGRSRAFVKVQDGCNHRCTYCIVWRARGASASVPVEAVIERVREAVEAGQGEVVLTGVDLGSYGRDIGTRLAVLARRVADIIGNNARLRLSSVNANDVTPELIELNAHPRLCSHWHMPLQSGSDPVLRAMHRGYRRGQFLRIVDDLRRVEPRTELTTDIMVGFPGETDADHADTLSLVETVGFLGCHVFRYSPRPDTPAAESRTRVDDAVARQRSGEVRRAAVASTHARLQAAVGGMHEVVWDRIENRQARGLTAGYHEVVAEARTGMRLTGLQNVLATSIDAGRLRATLCG
jgi:threonylcarbamoyladenosine tRNA methylthiotransferase MtaB